MDDKVIRIKDTLTDLYEGYGKSYERFKNSGKPVKKETEPMSDEYKKYVEKLNQPTITTPTKQGIVKCILDKLHKRAVNGSFEPTESQRGLMNEFFKHFASKENKKGYCLIGGYGCGKTEIMKAFVSTRFHPFDYLKSERLCMMTSAIEMVDHYNTDNNFNRHLETNLYIDDFGSEQRAKFMAKDDEPILSKFLEMWYMKNRDKNLYLTTNLSPEEIQNKYGGRVYSRLNELCEFMQLNGEDFRSK